MARYLVTGGAGFIGSHLVEALIAKGDHVTVLDDLSTGKTENLPPGVQLTVLDIADPNSVRDALAGMDGCFHLAAIASVERGQREWLRSHLVNLSGTIAIFEEARRAGALSGTPVPVVYASSAAVYGDPTEIPISEQSATYPISAYGVDKLGCDLHAFAAARVHNVSTIGLRFFNIYGPRQDPSSPYSGVISIFCERVLQRQRLELHGDGRQVRDFVYVDDAVRALQLSMHLASLRQMAEVFNVCSGRGTTIKELGATISDLEGAAFVPSFSAGRTGDVRTSLGDPTHSRKELRFKTRTPLRQGLRRTLDSLRSGKHRAAADPNFESPSCSNVIEV